jgi:hypothetical protein
MPCVMYELCVSVNQFGNTPYPKQGMVIIRLSTRKEC